MSKQLKVVFVPFKGTGPINSSVGLAQVLFRAGHKVVFAVDNKWKRTVEGYGFEIVTMQVEEDCDEPVKEMGLGLMQSNTIGDKSPLSKAVKFEPTWIHWISYYIKLDTAFGPVLHSLKPDVVVLDQFCTLPSVQMSGIPWVWVWSAAPLYMYGDDPDVPPYFSGLSALEDRSVWKEYRDEAVRARVKPWQIYKDYFVSKGAQPLNPYNFCDGSPHLNLYSYPSELDYSDVKPLPKHYIRLDNLMRIERQSFEIPKQLRDRPGKLIYFSFGSMASVDVELMKRLVTILANSPHRFIVSKGPIGESYELPDNMWGQNTVPQIHVLSVADLFITHGGNNSVTEAFFFGRPMIVLPMFGDQYENAQRIHDKGFGIRLNPYRCSAEELLQGIERLLNDKELKERLKNISKRIQTENSIAKLPRLIENLIIGKQL